MILARFPKVQPIGSAWATGRSSGRGSSVNSRISGPRLAMSPENRMLLPMKINPIRQTRSAFDGCEWSLLGERANSGE